MRVALITEFLPWPLDNAPKIRLFEELKILTQDNSIDLFCLLQPDAEPAWPAEVEKLGVRVFTAPVRSGWSRSFTLQAKSLLGGEPLYFSKWFNGPLYKMFADRLDAEGYDLVHVDHSQMAGYVPKAHRKRAVLVMHNLEHVLLDRYADVAPSYTRPFVRREATRIRRVEAELCCDFAWIVCMTDVDRSRIAELAPDSSGRVVAIPTCVNTDYFKPQGEQKSATPTIVMTGDFRWPPTKDGLLWFLSEVFPKIAEGVPEICFYVVGPIKERDKKAFSDGRVVFTGMVDDVRPYLERSWLFVNPLRAAAGIRTRLLHALSMELCAVSTHVGFEGLDEVLREFVWCEDEPDSFAERCTNLLGERKPLIARGRAARGIVSRMYGVELFKERWLELYREIGS